MGEDSMIDTAELRLNLGCSTTLEPGYINVDIGGTCDQVADLSKRYPWEDNSVDYIRAWDIIEHIEDKIHTMNEIFRVLRPGGRAEIVVPTTDGRGAWQDCDHKSYWNPNSFFYFEHGNPHLTRFAPMNGVKCAFRIISQEHREYADKVWKLTILLEAVK